MANDAQIIHVDFLGIGPLTPPIDTSFILEPAERLFIAELERVINQLYDIIPDAVSLQPCITLGQPRLVLRVDTRNSFAAIKLVYNTMLMRKFAHELKHLVDAWNCQSPTDFYHQLRGTAILQRSFREDDAIANDPEGLL
ncbi:MAG TPA: hypothetical protein VNG90_05710 [Candidatus Acidoferrum sp.]|nr:hypothetical protein [Candidatus Acidoferrum sp.]